MSVESETGSLYLWDIHTGGLIKKQPINAEFIYHPSTYLNKLVFKSNEKGNNFKLFLYNFNTEKIIFTFDLRALSENTIEITDEITCVEQSPVVDILAVGFESGTIILINLKTNTFLMKFKSHSKVNALSFSNCADMDISLLVSSGKGEIAFWDLNKKVLHYVLRQPHGNYHVENIQFLPGENTLLSSSGYHNSLKMWVFDKDSVVPRLLKEREGHSEYPHHLRFYGDDDNKLFTASKDGTLRNYSVLNEHQSCQFSQVCVFC
jgi:U3 small nucleolar RNA-associated protein 21